MSEITQLGQALTNLSDHIEPDHDFNLTIAEAYVVFADVPLSDPLWWDKAHFVSLPEALRILGGKTPFRAYIQRWSGGWEDPEPWPTVSLGREQLITALAENNFTLEEG